MSWLVKRYGQGIVYVCKAETALWIRIIIYNLIMLDLLIFISHSYFLSNAPETRSKSEDKSILQWVEIYLIDKLSLQ